MNKTDLIQKVKALEGLTQDERAYLVNLVNTKKKYGLVWEDKPEEVEEQLRDSLPVLNEVKEKAIVNGDDYPNHVLIEGDNLHALTALSFTHEGKIDVIYIDPPYNTGNKDFIYNDYYVDWEDSFKHSKWISFMKRRLEIAKRLLSVHGKILISIDDNEQAQLKLLCDQIFGENNFMANFIWRGGKRNAAKHISTSHEYMMLYAKSVDEINSSDISFKVRKKGIEDIYKVHKALLKEYKDDFKLITQEIKKWFKSLPEDNPAKDHKHYCNVDKVGVYFASDISRGGGGGPKWELTSPITGNKVKTPSRGWAFSTIDDLHEAIKKDLIHFSPDDGVPCFKRYLRDNENTIIETTIYKDRRAASKKLRAILGDGKFDFPKDDEIISYFIKATGSSNDITVLDFFAGSGTTLHSTMQLNLEDQGKRQCILVTNNENNICEEVTYERNRRIIQGYTNAKGIMIEGLTSNNLRYYKSNYVSREPSLKNKRELTQFATELLCIKEDCYNEEGIDIERARMFRNRKVTMLLLFDDHIIPQAVEFIKGIDDKEIKVYVFSIGSDPYTEDFAEVLDKVTLCALPDAIYKAYQNVLPKRKRTAPIVEEETALTTNENGEQLSLL